MLLSLFSRLIVRILSLCVLLCVLAPMLVGHPPAEDTAWTKFGFGECQLPCFAGITPEQTAFDDVPTLLAHHVYGLDPRMIAGGASINFWAQIENQQLSGVIRNDQGWAGEMHFNVVLPLSQIIDQLGVPDCVLPSVNDAGTQVTIFWQRGGISIGAVLSPGLTMIDPGTDTLALWLQSVQPSDCVRYSAPSWRGFAPIWNYLKAGSGDSR